MLLETMEDGHVRTRQNEFTSALHYITARGMAGIFFTMMRTVTSCRIAWGRFSRGAKRGVMPRAASQPF